MRNYLLVLVMMLGLSIGVSAQETSVSEVAKKPGGYVINGTINGEYNGKVYLFREESLHGAQTLIDSSEVVDGKYHFEGDSVSVVMIHYIKGSDDRQMTPLFLENGEINIVADANNFMWATVSGTPNNDLRELYKMYTRYVQDSVTRTTVVDWKIYGRGDEETQSAEFKRRTQHIMQRWLSIQTEMVKKYSDQVFAPFIMAFEMTADASLDELKALRAMISPSLSDHPYTKMLDEFIDCQTFDVGSKAYEFTLKSLDGKEISLSDYKGKYVFLDFWASWCGPCRREMPNVQNLYKEYRKDLVIIGISLDRDEAKWKDAVKEFGMKWLQCNDPKEFYGTVAQRYKVSAIPRTVLINPEGNVVALDLRGEKLVEEVGKFLNNK